MPRAAAENLPIELHFEIFKNLFRLSAEEIEVTEPWSREPLTLPIRTFEWQWIERDKRNPNQFPHNVYQVCRTWGDRLVEESKCWTRLIFDVAVDPKADIVKLLWSKHIPRLEITIFNSGLSTTPTNIDSSVERERVSAIVNALRPHIWRCKSIIFDVAYLTSLPSPVIFLQGAPYLHELLLDCKINNAGTVEDHHESLDELEHLGPDGPCPLLPKLLFLSIPGFWLMTIAGHPHTSQWLREISFQKEHFNLSVSHFAFEFEGQYSLENFASYCSGMKPSTIVLRDLSVIYDVDIMLNVGLLG